MRSNGAEAMQPDLYNAAIRLQSLQLRLASLQRIAELGGVG
jgi:hypothetical protein